MLLRKSTEKDVIDIMQMIDDAKKYLKNNNINQWQNGYPNTESIEADVRAGISYVLENDGEIIASTVITYDKEETYEVIYDGKWLSETPYATLHRVVVKNDRKGQGIGTHLFNEVKKVCQKENVASIKIDTHDENESMKRLIVKNDFTYCGVIILSRGLEAGHRRNAYEILI